jgi:hypothetical protein
MILRQLKEMMAPHSASVLIAIVVQDSHLGLVQQPISILLTPTPSYGPPLLPCQKAWSANMQVNFLMDNSAMLLQESLAITF